MNREEIALKPCPFCGEKLERHGDYTPENAWNFYEHHDPDDSKCILKDIVIQCGPGMETPDGDEAAAWNTRALPAQGEPVRDQLVNALSAIEQRANESGTGEMGLLDTVHAMARIARVALALVKP